MSLAARCSRHADPGSEVGPVAGCHECAAEAAGLRTPVVTVAANDRARPRCTYTLDADIVAWLEGEAKRTGFKMSQIVEDALRQYRATQVQVRLVNRGAKP